MNRHPVDPPSANANIKGEMRNKRKKLQFIIATLPAAAAAAAAAAAECCSSSPAKMLDECVEALAPGPTTGTTADDNNDHLCDAKSRTPTSRM